jgi:hypothetical protein
MRSFWKDVVGPSGADADSASGPAVPAGNAPAGAAAGPSPGSGKDASADTQQPAGNGADKTNARGDHIVTVPGVKDPVNLEEENEYENYNKYYEIALQGTSGQYDDPKEATRMAKLIAEKCNDYLDKKFKAGDKNDPDWRNVYWTSFRKYFDDALPGTASHFKKPDEVVSKAGEEAERSIGERAQERAKIHWKHADLPAPMGADCKIVRGKVTGPKNHALCETHEHIIDTDSKMVIAHDLEEYKKLFPK